MYQIDNSSSKDKLLLLGETSIGISIGGNQFAKVPVADMRRSRGCSSSTENVVAMDMTCFNIAQWQRR